jgi:hypothetical protein
VFIWYILCSFGTFCVRLVHFSGFGIMQHEKSGNPGWVGDFFTETFRRAIVRARVHPFLSPRFSQGSSKF